MPHLREKKDSLSFESGIAPPKVDKSPLGPAAGRDLPSGKFLVIQPNAADDEARTIPRSFVCTWLPKKLASRSFCMHFMVGLLENQEYRNAFGLDSDGCFGSAFMEGWMGDWISVWGVRAEHDEIQIFKSES